MKSVPLGIVSNARNQLSGPGTRSQCPIGFSKLGTSETPQMLEWLLTLAEEDYI
jgi:hypothetical protein